MEMDTLDEGRDGKSITNKIKSLLFDGLKTGPREWKRQEIPNCRPLYEMSGVCMERKCV